MGSEEKGELQEVLNEEQKELKESVEELTQAIRELTHIKVKDNGSEKEIHIIDLIQGMYRDLAFWRDVNIIHSRFKKYKIYWIGGALIALWFGIDVKTLLIKLIG